MFFLPSAASGGTRHIFINLASAIATRDRLLYLLNREPCGRHLKLMADTGFKILTVSRMRRPTQLHSEQLAQRFRGMTKDELTTASAFVIGRKPDSHER